MTVFVGNYLSAKETDREDDRKRGGKGKEKNK